MGKPHPIELRERPVKLVEQGNTHSKAGLLEPKPQGNSGRGKLTGVRDCVPGRIAAQPDLTSDELTAELGSEHGLTVHRSSVGRLLHRLGTSRKKDRSSV